MRKTKPTLERFWAKVQKSDNCWLWTASVRGHGYGQFYNGTTIEDSHRFSYRIHIGQIPEGKVIMHTCDVPACVNPSHLKAATQKENLRDMYAKGRQRPPETYIKGYVRGTLHA